MNDVKGNAGLSLDGHGQFKRPAVCPRLEQMKTGVLFEKPIGEQADVHGRNPFPHFRKNRSRVSSTADRILAPKSGGTAFPTWRNCSVLGPVMMKSSGNDSEPQPP